MNGRLLLWRLGRWFDTTAAVLEIVGGFCVLLAVYSWAVTR
jgi:hypothetical protein